MDDLRIELMSRYRFSERAIDLCIQARFCCAYCGLDVLELFEDFRFSETDHLLPKSKYPGLIDVTSNHVLSCQTCNILKRNWDPNDAGSVLVAESATCLSDDERNELIRRTKGHVQAVRQTKRTEFEQYRSLLRQLCPTPPDLPMG